MSDEQQSHPLYGNRNSHPLSDQPQQQAPEEQGTRIPIPLNATIPILTYALIAINVGIFVLRYISPDLSFAMISAGYIDVDAVMQDRQLYRLFTAMFLHFDETHILFNGIALYYVGGYLERYFGHLRFAIVYVLGGLAGSILPLFFGSGGLGASGAVFALWGAEIVFFYLHRDIFGQAGRARLRSSLMLMAVNFFIGFSANALASVTDSPVRIGNAAHFGGLLGGAILAWFIAPRFLPKRVPQSDSNPVGVEIVQTNPLSGKYNILVSYGVGLLALLLMAIFLRA